MAKISDRIRKGLEIREMKQTDLVKITGIGKSSISTYISGNYEPKQKNIYKIAKALNVNEAWLMGFDAPMERDKYERQSILNREAMLDDIESILKSEDYQLCCEDYSSDFFTIQTSFGQTVASFYNYELFFKYEMLKRNGNITAESLILNSSKLNSTEQVLIEKYRTLDDFGKERIDYELAKEIERVARIQKLETENQEISEKITLLRIYTYFGRVACAGESFDFSEIPDETIEAPYMEGADFIIGVNGDSMEPDYHDGDRLYVKKTDHMSYGDVGIFTINNECFLKEYGEDGLVSRNKNYKDIAGTEDVRMIGKVIGKVEED